MFLFLFLFVLVFHFFEQKMARVRTLVTHRLCRPGYNATADGELAEPDPVKVLVAHT